MKKFRTAMSVLLVAMSLTSCYTGNSGSEVSIDFDIFDTKDIVLGEEVESVNFTSSTGVQFTFTNEDDFDDIFIEVGYRLETGKKYSCNAEIKTADMTKSYVNTNIYYFEDGMLVESRAKKEGSDDVALIEEYQEMRKLGDNQSEHISFNRYIYKDEIAFCGANRGPNVNIQYKSNKFPMNPEYGTELHEMQSRADQCRNFVISVPFFADFPQIGQIDFRQFVTREYTLYENYIVFKQTAPIFYVSEAPGKDMEILYNRCVESNYSATQEAYCNVKTGKIEFIKAYGNTMNPIPGWYGFELEINMQMYIHDFNVSEYQEKLDAVVRYVKANADV